MNILWKEPCSLTINTEKNYVIDYYVENRKMKNKTQLIILLFLYNVFCL